MQKNFKHSGATLLELLIVIALVGVLMAGATNLLEQGFVSFFAGEDIINANWQGSIALERIARDLHATRSSSDIITADANSMTIIDLDGNTTSYQVVGNQLQRNAQYIADGITNITFAYYTGDTTPSLLTPLPLSSLLRLSIRYVVITLNINYNNLNFPITTAVYLWALK